MCNKVHVDELFSAQSLGCADSAVGRHSTIGEVVEGLPGPEGPVRTPLVCPEVMTETRSN